MKSTFKLLAALSLILIIVSCGEDEQKIVPIVGKWELYKVTYPTPPAGFLYLRVSDSDASLWGELIYQIEFLADKTYKRQLKYSSGSPDRDNGEWTLKNGELDLDQEETTDDNLFFVNFTLDGTITDDKMTLLATDNSWPTITTEFAEKFNATIDTITSNQSYYNVLLSNAVSKSIEFSLEFEKQ
jgi:hypothetical protein